MDHPFRSAAVGGFNKQDVLTFLEAQAKQTAQAQQELQGRLEEAERQGETLRREREDLTRELEEAEKTFERNDQRRLECSLAYANTEITIGEAVLRLRQENHQCVIRLLAGEIVVM